VTPDVSATALKQTEALVRPGPASLIVRLKLVAQRHQSFLSANIVAKIRAIRRVYHKMKQRPIKGSCSQRKSVAKCPYLGRLRIM
jgi:hypothetical protein